MIIFHHTPKSGGSFIWISLIPHFKFVNLGYGSAKSSFEKQIQNYFGVEKENTILQTNASDISQVELIRGHDKFRNYHKKSPNDFYFTSLRDPTDMFYSEVIFKHRMGHGGPNSKFSLQIPQHKQYLNRQIDAYIASGEVWRNDFFKDLDRFDFVAINEYMEQSIAVLRDRFKRPIVPANRQVNVFNSPEKRAIYEYRREEVKSLYIGSNEEEIYNTYVDKLVSRRR